MNISDQGRGFVFLAVQAKLETLDAAGSLCTTGEIFLGPLRMTEGELLALLVARRALQQYQGTPFHHQLEVAFEKLAGGLKDRISFSPADELQAVSFKSIGVGKANFQMRLYSLIPLWFIYYEGGPRCGSLLIKPRLDPADLSHVDRPKDMGETANWPGMRHYDVDLGIRLPWSILMCSKARKQPMPSERTFVGRRSMPAPVRFTITWVFLIFIGLR